MLEAKMEDKVIKELKEELTVTPIKRSPQNRPYKRDCFFISVRGPGFG